MWPDGYKLHGKLRTGYKLYFDGKLCVPTGLGYKIVAAKHIISGHIGAKKNSYRTTSPVQFWL